MAAEEVEVEDTKVDINIINSNSRAGMVDSKLRILMLGTTK